MEELDPAEAGAGATDFFDEEPVEPSDEDPFNADATDDGITEHDVMDTDHSTSGSRFEELNTECDAGFQTETDDLAAGGLATSGDWFQFLANDEVVAGPERPSLDALPDGYVSDLLVMGWLEFLVVDCWDSLSGVDRGF